MAMIGGALSLADRRVDVANRPVRQGRSEPNATVIVGNWADWCELRKRLASALERFHALEGSVRFAKLDVAENPQAPRTCGVRGILTTNVLREARVVSHTAGSAPADTECAELGRRFQAA